MARKSIYRPEHRIFAELLRDVRMQAELTQEQLATTLDVDQAFVSEAERGRRRLDTVQVRDWCLACGIDLVHISREFQKRLSNPRYQEPREPDGRRRPR
ncbi:helix-turn-helix domain-containing protein [Dyella choica]|uniref:XRE family transcriptional regulator n=1 Tax=Dyella choica TaxID=1927959 RepID=A0A432M0T3_9GAMM|nr:helix-turn-helix transcriptional regulator [Dyella choica]RUL70518.1 XRE family transcriptional regulator [Dyella choica]